MKSFFVTFVIYAIVNLGTYTAGQNPRLITSQISAANDDITALIKELGEGLAPINDQIEKADYGIKSNAQVINVQNQINNQRLKRTILGCQSLLDDKIKSLTAEFIATSKNDATKRINYMTNEAQGFLNEFKTMNDNLAGSKLDVQVEICENNRNKCLISTYAFRVSQINSISRSDRSHLQTMPFDIFSSLISPTLNQVINTKIFQPVDTCIRHQKHR